jgi:hypothetical protein
MKVAESAFIEPPQYGGRCTIFNEKRETENGKRFAECLAPL